MLVILFMMFYYRASGFYSTLALVFNMLLILAALAAIGATLTLPGIAGIILTIGMAVDANVIIYERIREELLNGRSIREAMSLGFDKALSAVMDANITTGIAGLVLLQYGTGPIRGFAVTLLIGIVSTIFTAVVFSRLLFDTKIPASTKDAISI
jgi:preprotein translocase subunit SecD